MKKNRKKNVLQDTTILEMAQTEHIRRHGEAASQMIQANKGVRYDTVGRELGHAGRSLSGISEYRLNPQMYEQNIKQQAGFSAELVEEARENRRNILEENKNRVRTTDGLGQTNHQKYDLVDVDEHGTVISGSGTQMKFLGIDKQGRYSVIEKIVKDPAYSKYDTVIEIPKDQFDGAVEYAKGQAQELQQQAEVLRRRGNDTKADELETKAEKYLDATNKIQKSNLTLEEARNARIDPDRFTAKEVLNNSIEAGVQAMAAAAFISGMISIAQNTVGVMSGEKDIESAVTDTIKTTVDAGCSAMFVGTAGTALKAAMHTSETQFVRCLGNTVAPTMIATSMLHLSKGLMKFANGEITASELFVELGEKSVCSLAAGFGAGLGGIAGKELAVGIGGGSLRTFGSIAGGTAGGMVTYTLCGILCRNIMNVLKEKKIAKEQREYMEQLCNYAVLKMKEYRMFLDAYRKEMAFKNQEEFQLFFDSVDAAVSANDLDGIYRSFNCLGSEYGLQMQFRDQFEFERFMNDKCAVLKL